jgi:hypothetical protein
MGDKDEKFYWAIAIAAVILWLIWSYASALSLEVSGVSAGHGTHFLNFSGEQLFASINISQNSSTWHIIARS